MDDLLKPWQQRVEIESWPHRVRFKLRDWDPHWGWLDANVGTKGRDWDYGWGCYLFKRVEDSTLFSLTWL